MVALAVGSRLNGALAQDVHDREGRSGEGDKVGEMRLRHSEDGRFGGVFPISRIVPVLFHDRFPAFPLLCRSSVRQRFPAIESSDLSLCSTKTYVSFPSGGGG